VSAIEAWNEGLDGWIDREIRIRRFEVRERRDGPRFVEAIRGAGKMRRHGYPYEQDCGPPAHWGRPHDHEIERGVPVGWFGRPVGEGGA